MRTLPFLAALAVTAAALPAAATGAQAAQRAQRSQREPEMVPTILITSALKSFGAGEFAESPMFVVGRTPADWPAALRPAAPATVVGGMRLGPVNEILVAWPRAADAVAAYAAQLARAGYRKIEALDTNRPTGFTGSEAGRSALRGTAFCRDSGGVVLVSPVDSTATTRRIVVMRAPPDLRGAGCGASDAQRQAVGRVSVSPALHLPPLPAPLGANVRSGGMSQSGDSFHVSATADTSLSASALLAHYTAELVRGGWTATGSPAGSNDIAIRSLTARDEHGAQWQGAIMIYTTGDRRQIDLGMTKPGGW